MKDAPPKIGEPADQWPLTTLAKKHENIKCKAELNGPAVPKCSCVACRILGLPRVTRWIWQAGGVDLADRRACSLITGVAVALHNAAQPFVTPAHHRKHYIDLADRIERKPGKKRLAKLQRDLRKDKAPGLQRYEEGMDIERLAQFARVFAGACNSPNWTNPRPYHEHAARNDFIRAMNSLQMWCAGSSSHELTADIVAAMFPGQETNGAEVERLTRSKSP